MIDLRLRSRISDTELAGKIGKVLGPRDVNLLLTGPALVRKPDGRPLCVYLPGAMESVASDEVYGILHGLRGLKTENRGDASGTKRIRYAAGSKNDYALPVSSAIIGAFDAAGRYRYCRLTAWTGRNLPAWQRLQPFLQGIAEKFREHVPDRYRTQAEHVARTRPEWVVPGTPFTTITVNNTYPTGVHVDAGDLPDGFSTLAVLRRGAYSGGLLCFPRFRVAVDLADADLLLMDAHELHGNTAIVCACGKRQRERCEVCGAERISVVSYFRTGMTDCGTVEEEHAKAIARRERRLTGEDLALS